MTDQTHQNNDDRTSGFARAKDSASQAYSSSKASAQDAARRASDGIEANPLAIVVGGLAVGALAGALLPRSDKERELLAPVGKRLGETARQALAAAKHAGRQELDGAGLTPDSARDRGKELLGGLGKALSSAGAAAAQSAKGGQGDGAQGKEASAPPRQPSDAAPFQA